MHLKIHNISGCDTIVAACDADLIGQTLTCPQCDIVVDESFYGSECATEEEIINACKIAQAHEFISSFPDGYKTELGQGGVNLSGGQKQRLAIARALVKQPEILILDDSASALDYVTDSKLRQAIKELGNNITTFIVSQRTASIRNADKIIVLEDGEIVGIGTHDELLSSCEIYQEIYNTDGNKAAGGEA